MIETACIVAVVLLAGFQEFRHSRAQDRFQVERDQWASERQTLLQRIQAPEVAVTQHQVDNAGPDLPAVGIDDDAGYWKARQEQAEALERMEQLEREFEARLA